MSFHATQTAELTWVMFAGAAVIFVLVLGTLGFALYGSAQVRRPLSRRWLIIGAGVIFPVAVLSALLAYSFAVTARMARTDTPPAVRIEVVGEMWWWRLRYLDQNGQLLFETANDIRIPVGVPVDLVLTSDNVIHSFWAPKLAGKLDMIPGHVNLLRVQVRQPGLYRGQCAEYCGAQHAKMMFDLRAVTVEEFQAWVAAQRLPAMEPANATLQVGKQIFMQACTQCHTVRGVNATGTLGPDLTHVGSRSSLAAGVLPNTIGALAGWIAGSQHIKPGNQMPSFDQLTGENLRAIAQYMDSLK
ncbi:cytochrome c oxidase subunit II [Pusillimonas sp. T7-7]|uniref:cytochrome c oxidase subunit II n=1 Tax=Pusillimonas sp. (strain T7-7) TaxID=1007105 RepID=UPI000318A322|nr:cytochrome c oxidase subunit II [Pusillimonas sp. T7-7]